MAQTFRSASSQGLRNDNKTQLGVIFSDIGTELDERVQSVTSGISGADQIVNMVSLTQAEYDAIVSPDSSTFYIITP